MTCMQHHQQYDGPLCPQCVREIAEGGRPATLGDVRRIVREELSRIASMDQRIGPSRNAE